MPEAFLIGPLLIPTRVAGLVFSALLAIWLVRRVAIFLNIDAVLSASIAEYSLWVGIAASRLGYVVWNWSAFADKPWTAVYFWQPGYSIAAGLVAALVYALYRIIKQQRVVRSSIAAALGAGFTLPAILFTGMLITMNKFVDPNVLTPGDSVSQYQLTDLNGKPVSFDDYKGKGMVVNFWATWCPPCRREMPLLESVYQQYKSQDVIVIGISMGEPRDIVRRYVGSVGVTYPIWGNRARPEQVTIENGVVLSEKFNVVGLPTTFFIDRNGTIQSSRVGELNRAILQERIPELIR